MTISALCAARHAVEPFLHLERLHLVDGDARPLRLAMVLPGAQVEALGIARAVLVPALKPRQVAGLEETADCRHGALVAPGRLYLRQLVAGLAVRAVHGAAPAPAPLRRVLDPAEHVLLAARGLRDGAPGAPPRFSWHNITAFLFGWPLKTPAHTSCNSARAFLFVAKKTAPAPSIRRKAGLRQLERRSTRRSIQHFLRRSSRPYCSRTDAARSRFLRRSVRLLP